MLIDTLVQRTTFKAVDPGEYVSPLAPFVQYLQDALSDLWSSLEAGDLSADAWYAAMLDELSTSYTAAYMAGAATSTLTAADLANIAYYIGNQATFLDNFRFEIQSAAKFMKGWRARAESYAAGIAAPYWKGETRILPLPAMPGDGNSICKSNCKCLWEVEQLPGDNNYDAYWVLGHADHCFPAGTMIDTISGRLPIESMRIGDRVRTLYGYKRVTHLFKHEYKGELSTVTANGHSVQCTPNHPFLTQRGWVRADRLQTSDQAVILKNGHDPVFCQITLPDAHHAVPAFSKISIPGLVADFLGKLPIGKRFKAWMPVPIIPIGLNDQIANTDINDKLRLDEIGSFILDTNLVQHTSELEFKPAGLISLPSLLTSNDLRLNFSQFLRVLAASLEHFLQGSRCEHRVIFGHVLPRFGIYNTLSSLLRELEPMSISLVSDNFRVKSQSFSDFNTTFARVMNAQISDFIVCPEMTAVHPSMTASRASLTGSIPAVMTADRTPFSENWIVFSGNNDSSIPAQNAAITWLIRTALLTFERSLAKLANKLSLGSGHASIITKMQQSVHTVYNLEVEDCHQYVANDFVVHNCQTCIERAALWKPLRIRNGRLDLSYVSPMTMESKESKGIANLRHAFLHYKHITGQHNQRLHGNRGVSDSAVSSIKRLTLSGGDVGNVSFSDEERASLAQTVQGDYTVYRGLGLIKSRMTSEQFEQVRSLKAGDPAPAFLVKQGNPYASYSKSPSVAKRYAEGEISVIIRAQPPKKNIVVDTANLNKLADFSNLFDKETKAYFQSEKEVIVQEPVAGIVYSISGPKAIHPSKLTDKELAYKHLVGQHNQKHSRKAPQR